MAKAEALGDSVHLVHATCNCLCFDLLYFLLLLDLGSRLLKACEDQDWTEAKHLIEEDFEVECHSPVSSALLGHAPRREQRAK